MCLHACKDLLKCLKVGGGGGGEKLSNKKTMCTIYLIPLLEYDNEHDQHIEHYENLM